MRLLIYQTGLAEIGGIETFLVNLVKALWEYYDIKVIYDCGDYKQINRLSKYVEIEKYDRTKKYETDIFLRTSSWVTPANNIKAKRYIDMRHNDFDYLKKQGLVGTSLRKLPWDCEVVGCGENAAKMSSKALNEKVIPIENLLGEKKEPKKILKLFSCCRLNDEKGENNMVKFADMLRKAGIKFEWRIFSTIPTEKVLDGEEIHYYKPQYDLTDYVADSDYSVLLSKLEGLPYQILEALQLGKPCIVTDIGGNTEKIKDGKNGYVVPIDENGEIKDFDVKKLLKIPTVPEYSNNSAEKWKKFLGGAKYKKKSFRKQPEIKQDVLEVVKTCEYDKYGDIINLIPKKNRLTGWLIRGDEIVVPADEGNRLIKEGICVRKR